MSRRNLKNRTGRRKLAPRHKPYWVSVRRGVYLGYRAGEGPGSWRARAYAGNKRYKEKYVGTADDFDDADGVNFLDFDQAQEQAAAFGRELALQTVGGVPTTVSELMEEYMKWYRENRKSVESVRYTIDAHITPKLGSIPVRKLSTAEIRKWHRNLVSARLRKRGGARVKIDKNDPEVIRKRRATANRILTVLKAGLNYGFKELDNVVDNDIPWRKVSPFKNVSAPRVRYLTAEEATRLINTCDGDFRLLVRAALLTGARYGELRRLKVRDFDTQSGTVHIRESKSGSPRDVHLTDEGLDFFDTQIAGRKPGEIVFSDASGNPWGKSAQSRPMKDATARAELESVTFHILRHTYASLLASSGVPLKVIAEALGHKDTRTTEKHYAHLQKGYVSEMIRANLPTFIDDRSNVRRIGARR